MSSSLTFSLAFFLFFIQIFPFISQALVPASSTFKYVNEGEFGDYIVQYDASYRFLPIFASPGYQICWYNTTPNTYYLSLLMGTVRSTSTRRWVWDFNRGNPVKENATFSLGTNGNLIVADADGRVAWQSGTANKGVVGFELLGNGNMVLKDAKGKFIWQSFNYATDTILVGQSLQNLVSRASPEQNVNGPYSLVLESNRFVMYYKGKKSPKPQAYFDSTGWLGFDNRTLEYVRLSASPEAYNTFELTLEFRVANSLDGGGLYLGRTKYNNTASYLQLGIDGTLNAYTFDREVDISAWETTFTLFSPWNGEAQRVTPRANGCQLPERCGDFGLCDRGQCVACPSPNGLLGWSEKCNPSKISSCAVKDTKYYKLIGVDHFITTYTKGAGPIKESECAKKCTLDCKCSGYFYHLDKSTCWIAYDLMTLIKVTDKKHLGYIKY